MDCPPPEPTMEVTTFEYEGEIWHNAIRTSDVSATEALYTRSVSEDFYHWKGTVMFDSYLHIRRMGYRHWTRLPHHLQPLIDQEGVCYDPVSRLLSMRHEATVLQSRPYTEPVEWIIPLTSIADINRDYLVNAEDFGILLADWGTSATRSDLDRDGTVDGSDIGLLLLNWS